MLNSPALSDTAKLVGRVLLALMFVLAGYSKIGGYAGTQQYMASAGVPAALLPLVIAVELLGGLMVVVGWKTRYAALALAAFTLAATLLFHTNWAQPMQQMIFMKNISVVGGFLVLFAAGAGRWSLDRA
ncbi:DoxX family protein [Bosea sp. (in: a-proteobacteria)]|jgi:putative oxidoreductase|uniref:DoxX family protein n=1 Tax=Bosea sp. (in: a-proteobacteria) TaxID=1871050 RepID=UPI003F726C43